MAARFYAGASIKATRTTAPRDKVPPPQSNTMKGLPGYIKTGQDTSMSGAKGGKGAGPKREGPIGERGGAHRGIFATKNLGGSSDRSYKANSTGKPGKIVSNGKMESLKGRAKFSMER